MNKFRNILFRSSISFFIVVLISKMASFVFVVLLGIKIGATHTLDTFLLLQSFPLAFTSIIGSGIMSSILAKYNPSRKTLNSGLIFEFIKLIIKLSSVFNIGFFSVIAIVFAANMNNLQFFLISLFIGLSVFFQLTNPLLSSILMIKGNYFTSQIGSLILPIINTIILLIPSFSNVFGLALGTFLGYVTTTVFLLIRIKLPGEISLSRDYSVKSKELRNYIHSLIFISFNNTPNYLFVLLERFFPAFIGNAAVSLYTYSIKGRDIFRGLFIEPISKGMALKLASVSSSKDNYRVAEKLVKTMSIVLSIVIFFMILLSKYLIGLLYSQGKFTENELKTINTLFVFYIISTLPLTINNLIARYFFRVGREKKVVEISWFTIILATLLNASFIGIRDIKITALSYTLAVFVQMFLLLRLFARERP